MNDLSWGRVGWVAAVLIGHFGLHIAIINRSGGLGLDYRLVKVISRLVAITSLVIPWWAAQEIGSQILTRSGSMAVPIGWSVYGAVCLAVWVIFGIPWLLSRPLLGIGQVAARREVEVVRLGRGDSGRYTLTRRAAWLAKAPLNQMLELAVEKIELPVVGLPEGLDGYRIAHLSDLHFTGDLAAAWTGEAVERANAFGPDLMALTGDIIDAPHCLRWLDEALGHAEARDGCYFILGNHDVRRVVPQGVRDEIVRLGWIDVGGRGVPVDLSGRVGGGGEAVGRGDDRAVKVPAMIFGNEAPWHPPPVVEIASAGGATLGESAAGSGVGAFRLLLSHSPDQIGWARRHGMLLMLAGHTHGGQGRLPLIGPVLSPSLHGTRYASGDFYEPPTTMHVTRGLGASRLVRIGCRPELSLLTLRTG